MSTKTKILLESGTNELEIVEFSIQENHNYNSGFQSYGLNVAKVREIIRLPQITVTPNLPPSIIGIFNLRDEMIPCLDLRKFLYNEYNTNENAKIIIVEFNKLKVGMLVNGVERIHRISWDQIVTPDNLQDISTGNNSLIGIVRFGNKNVLMIDIEKIVAEIDPKSAMDNDSAHRHFKGKPKVITAEDSPTIRKMITERLDKAGFEIIACNDGEEALIKIMDIITKVESGKGQLNDYVDLVITDIEMPKMDGYTLTKNIKSHKLLQKLPVIIFSSLVSPDIIHKGKAVGADAQLTKPQIGELLETLRYFLNEHHLN